MKKLLQTGLILSILFLSANAFSQESPKTYLDPVLNLVGTNFNYGNANNSLKDYKKSVLGAQVGVTFQAGITPAFSLVSEFYFMMKGGKLNVNNPLTTHERTLRLYTLELPVLARFHFGNVYANAGPSIAYNLNGTQKINDVSTHISFTNSGEAFKRLDAGVQVGGGYMFPMGQKRLALDIRYCYGLTNISTDKELYNRSLIVSIHFSKAWRSNPLAKNRNL